MFLAEQSPRYWRYCPWFIWPVSVSLFLSFSCHIYLPILVSHLLSFSLLFILCKSSHFAINTVFPLEASRPIWEELRDFWSWDAKHVKQQRCFEKFGIIGEMLNVWICFSQFPAAYCTCIRRYGLLSSIFDLAVAFYIIFLIPAFESISGSLNQGCSSYRYKMNMWYAYLCVHKSTSKISLLHLKPTPHRHVFLLYLSVCMIPASL